MRFARRGLALATIVGLIGALAAPAAAQQEGAQPLQSKPRRPMAPQSPPPPPPQAGKPAFSPRVSEPTLPLTPKVEAPKVTIPHAPAARPARKPKHPAVALPARENSTLKKNTRRKPLLRRRR